MVCAAGGGRPGIVGRVDFCGRRGRGLPFPQASTRRCSALKSRATRKLRRGGIASIDLLNQEVRIPGNELNEIGLTVGIGLGKHVPQMGLHGILRYAKHCRNL